MNKLTVSSSVTGSVVWNAMPKQEKVQRQD